MLSLATFGAGFVTRPIGAFVIGSCSDRVGRKPAMMLCFILIGGAIVGMALTPTYAQIGIAAPILAMTARMVQGLSLGGEIGSNTAFLLEAAPVEKRGLVVAWQGASQYLALVAGGLVGVLLTAALPPDALDTTAGALRFSSGPSRCRSASGCAPTFPRPSMRPRRICSRPGTEEALDLLWAILGLDGGYAVQRILTASGTTEVAPYLAGALGDPARFDAPALSPRQFAELFTRWHAFKSRMTRFFADYDVMLCPASAIPAPTHDTDIKSTEATMLSYTAPFSITGWPVAVVRTSTSEEGLPIGLQIVGKPFQEHVVLAVARFLEQEFGGFVPPSI